MTTTAATAALDCDARRAALGRQLAEMRTGAALVPPSFPLPVVPTAQDVVVEALPVTNDGTGWQIDGHATTALVDDLRGHAERLRQIAAQVPERPFSGRIQLALARSLSVADARALLDHLDEVGFNWVTLIVTDSAEVPPSHAPAMPAWVSESLTHPDPDRQSVLDRDFTRASGSCT